jgi:hypothetical protein
MQLLELAHVVCARRLQEAGQLGSHFQPSVRDKQILRSAVTALRGVDYDIEAALEAAEATGRGRPGVARYLDQLPSAEVAMDHFLARGAAAIRPALR